MCQITSSKIKAVEEIVKSIKHNINAKVLYRMSLLNINLSV